MSSTIRRVGIIFSGGPAPAANAVISAAATSFLSAGIEVVGFFHGYSHLVNYHPVTHRLLPGLERCFESLMLWRASPGSCCWSMAALSSTRSSGTRS